MGNSFDCLSKTKSQNNINIVVVGLTNSGKTEVCHILTQSRRTDFSNTNGIKKYKFYKTNSKITITEIGGADGMEKIWDIYFVNSFGIIYVVDISDYENIEKNCFLLTHIIRNPLVRHKPVLFVGSKADKSQFLNINDFHQITNLEYIANTYLTSIIIALYGKNDILELYRNFSNFINLIIQNFHKLKQRIEQQRELWFKLDDAKRKLNLPIDLNKYYSYIIRPTSAPSLLRKKNKVNINNLV